MLVVLYNNGRPPFELIFRGVILVHDVYTGGFSLFGQRRGPCGTPKTEFWSGYYSFLAGVHTSRAKKN